MANELDRLSSTLDPSGHPAIYITIEYVASEVLEMAGDAVVQMDGRSVRLEHVQAAINEDEDLKTLFAPAEFDSVRV